MSDEAGVIASNNTRLKFIPVSAVTMRDGFWKTRMERNRERGIPRLLKHLEDHGIVEAFRIASGKITGERTAIFWTDSDLFKWIEGASLLLQSYDDPQLRVKLDEAIDEVIAAQRPDGYLNTYFTGKLSDQRFRNLPVEHELYCAGHLFQAAVAHYRATGEDKLLNCACRYADFLAGYFGYEKHQGVDGHPEVEMSLVELYRSTGNKAYLELAEYFLSQWDFKNKQEVTGHAVRAMYLCCGGADYFAETGDAAYGEAVERLWNDLTLRKMYITGGVGSYYAGEEIGWAYDLPNERAYAETCAAIGSAMFSYRMLGITGEAKYADEMERAFYNGVISGVSLDGTAYFYQNPLACYRDYQRQEWFDCTCCPTNMVRTLAAIPGYMYSTSDEGIWVHLFDNSEVDWKLADGTKFTLKVETNYPWDGKVKITIGLDAPKEFTLFVRRPGWCSEHSVDSATYDTTSVDSADYDSGIAGIGSYIPVQRVWHPGEHVQLELAMPAEDVMCDPRVRENSNRIAVQRGPLVYCTESIDNAHGIRDLVAGTTEEKIEFQPDMLGGIVIIRRGGETSKGFHGESPLYVRLGTYPDWRESIATTITLIPYYAWANRGPSQMTVWMGSSW